MNSSSEPPDASTLPESLRLLRLIWNLNAALERTSHDMEANLGVTGPQRCVLRFVGLAPGITRDRLGTVMSRDASDLESDLAQLVARNLLVTRDGGGYHLTAQGAGINAVTNGTVERAVVQACDDASPYERTSFRRMLARIIGNLP